MHLVVCLARVSLSHPLVVFCDPGLVALLVVERRPGEVSRDDAFPLHEDGAAQRALVVRPHQHFRRLVGHLKRTMELRRLFVLVAKNIQLTL